MKLRVQHVMDAMLVISQIIRENRPMPQKGKYRLARLHAKLLPEYTTIDKQRDEMIRAYGHHQKVKGPDGVETETAEFEVPPDKMPEFLDAWREIAAQDIELEVEPIPLAQLDLGDNADGTIAAGELITLGELVKE